MNLNSPEGVMGAFAFALLLIGLALVAVSRSAYLKYRDTGDWRARLGFYGLLVAMTVVFWSSVSMFMQAVAVAS